MALAQSSSQVGAVSQGQEALIAKDDGFHTSAAVRARFETIDGSPRTGVSTNESWWNLRTNVAASWKQGVWMVGAEMTDSRIYGTRPGSGVSSSDVDAFEPTQFFVSANLGQMLGKGSAVKLTAGRMALNLGSRRLVAADDYRNAANTYTGLRADMSTTSGFGGTAIYVLPVARLPDDPAGVLDNRFSYDKESFSTILWGGLLNHKDKSGWVIEPSFYHFRERDWPGHATRDRHLNTAGLRYYRKAKPGKIDGEIEAMYQWGHESASTAPTAATLDVSATFVHALLGYTFPKGWRPRVSVEFDRVSGDSPGGTYGRFDTLFGMRRGDLAPPGLYSAIGRANIVAPGIRVEATPDKAMDFSGSWRPMWLADSRDSFSTTGVRDASGKAGSYAGSQFDLRVRRWLIPHHLRGEWDGVLLLKGRFLHDAPNAPAGGDTKYTALALTFIF
ncbi:MAG: alginate export family protein [Sphingomonadales bacterium]|nr:alginate export family protein [Sphingomonadales bacterium]MDE2168866.1 alginate export family protein [Sphingomonadales bacterium]